MHSIHTVLVHIKVTQCARDSRPYPLLELPWVELVTHVMFDAAECTLERNRNIIHRVVFFWYHLQAFLPACIKLWSEFPQVVIFSISDTIKLFTKCNDLNRHWNLLCLSVSQYIWPFELGPFSGTCCFPHIKLHHIIYMWIVHYSSLQTFSCLFLLSC